MFQALHSEPLLATGIALASVDISDQTEQLRTRVPLASLMAFLKGQWGTGSQKLCAAETRSSLAVRPFWPEDDIKSRGNIFAIVATKPANKAGRPAAEQVERRAGTGRNVDQQNTRRTQSRGSVPQALDRVRQAANIRGLSPPTPGRSRMP